MSIFTNLSHYTLPLFILSEAEELSYFNLFLASL